MFANLQKLIRLTNLILFLGLIIIYLYIYDQDTSNIKKLHIFYSTAAYC